METKTFLKAVKISLSELVCFHEELFCVLYCVYNCHVLTCIGQETIKYLILSYLIGAEGYCTYAIQNKGGYSIQWGHE